MPSPPEDILEAYARSLFDSWARDIERTLVFDDYSLFMVVEEGSVSGRSVILVAAGLFINGLAKYGDVRAGARQALNDMEWLADQFVERAKEQPLTADQAVRPLRHDSPSL